MSALSIVAGKSCWVLCIDGLVLSADGCVLDALSIAVKVQFKIDLAAIPRDVEIVSQSALASCRAGAGASRNPSPTTFPAL